MRASGVAELRLYVCAEPSRGASYPGFLQWSYSPVSVPSPGRRPETPCYSGCLWANPVHGTSSHL
ncbi:hypothetical protein ACRRTK_008889 [Alexandromys fortis]